MSADIQLLRALQAAREQVTEAIATAPSGREGWLFASADDVIRAARAILQEHSLLVLPDSGEIREEGEHLVLRLTLRVIRLKGRKPQQRQMHFDTEVDRHGAISAGRNLFALGLQLLLMMPRQSEHIELGRDRDDMPIGTERRVLPNPVIPRIPRVDERGLIEAACNELGLQLARQIEGDDERARIVGGKTPECWRKCAGVPIRGQLHMADLRSYRTWMEAAVHDTARSDESAVAMHVPPDDEIEEQTDTD